MEPASPPPKRTPAPRTPVGARNQPKAPTPGRSRPAPALFEDYAAFARAARRAAAAVGTRAAPGERRDAVADVCWRACADAVARRVPVLGPLLACVCDAIVTILVRARDVWAPALVRGLVDPVPDEAVAHSGPPQPGPPGAVPPRASREYDGVGGDGS